MNAVGIPDDIHTLLHEAGHAFHYFEALQLPYAQQRDPGLEFDEVASTAMDLIASTYAAESQGGFYTEEHARRFRLIDLGNFFIFWPYMAIVDAFQHWAYADPERSSQPDNCDLKWLELWRRFIPGVDWSGLEAEAMTGWHRKGHIYHDPFYYVEYGLAQVGALQVLRNAMRDPAKALEQYRSALKLGGTANLPTLYAVCGAKFAFDAHTLAEVVRFTEQTMQELEAV
jgi:oligoendopeptidase F